MFFFFFQAEDGIRDADVTGVQTCALPISVLAISLPDEETGWTAPYGSRNPQSHPTDGGRKPKLRRAADSRRTAEAGRGRVGAHGVSVLAEPTTRPSFNAVVARVLEKSSRSDRSHGSLHG